MFVGSVADASSLLDAARAALPSWGLDLAACGGRVDAVEDLHWVERYQAGLQPFPLGERFLVIPDGSDRIEPGRVSIVLVPGRAFGTGEHPTTRLCAAALERWVEPGSRWLDLGCGSSILAVVAAHCGAGHVLARDDDPEAIEVAREVLAANALTSRVGVEIGSAHGLRGAGLDGVVANIAARYFLDHGREAAAALREGGVLAASGFLGEDAAEIARALARAGLTTLEEDESEGWGLLVARRTGR
jgi:ribosomal protein L11 methyltransferase